MADILHRVLHQDFSRGWCCVDDFIEGGDSDDTEAFNRAISAMPESSSFIAGGGALLLTGRTYNISGPIIIEKSFKLVGCGSDSGTRILLDNDADCNMFEIGIRNSSSPMSAHMQGMRIEMARGVHPDGYSNIVGYNYLRHSHFVDLFVVGATAPNFEMKSDPTYSPARNIYFYGCAFEYGKEASLRINSDYNLNINSCYFGFGETGQNSYGLYLTMSADRFLLSNSWFLQDNRAGDMYISGVQNGHIIGNKFSPTASPNAGSTSIFVGTVNNLNIANNIFPDTSFPYYIRSGNTSQRIFIHGNSFGVPATQPFYFLDKSLIVCEGNLHRAYLRDNNAGQATIQAGDSYVTVSHGIFTTPDSVVATPHGPETVWVSDIGTTTFRINRVIPDSSGGDDLVCSWRASQRTY